MSFLKNLVIGTSLLAIGSCSIPSKNTTLENNLNFEEEMQNYEKQRVDSLQKLMNNVVEIRMRAKEKRELITKKNLSNQIEKSIRKDIWRMYDGTETKKTVSNLISQNLYWINKWIKASNVRGNLEVVGTGFVYKTCKGDVLITARHTIFKDKHFYRTSYGSVRVENKITNKEVFYNEKKVNLEKLMILSEPDWDLVITRLPDNFKKKTYPVDLTKKNELRAGEKVVKLGNTFGEGIQVYRGIITHNDLKGKIILGRKMEIRLLSLPTSNGDSGGPVFLENSLKFVGTIVGKDSVKDSFSAPMHAYVLPWENSIGKLKKISPYNECSYD